MKLIAQNFLGLERVEWEPRGVSLVVGPNGSGKTSLLQALAFLRTASLRSVQDAAKFLGPRGIKRLGAPSDAPILLGIEFDDLRWELEVVAESGSIGMFPGERVSLNGDVLVSRALLSDEWSFGEAKYKDDYFADKPRTCLQAAWDRSQDDRLRPLIGALRSLAIHDEKWSVSRLWEAPLLSASAPILSDSGANLFGVLALWRSAPKRYAGQYEWVRDKARQAFHDIFDDLDIELIAETGTVNAQFFPPGGREGLPVRRAAEGLIVGLLHLAVVAGAPPGSVVAIDEMENQLHPHAIRVILRAMRERAEERDLTIILTTHSPVLMNEFADDTEHFYVTEPGRSPTPVPLTEIHDRRYLAQFALGDLYDHLEFGAPKAG